MKYDEYQFLQFERDDDGILLITINRPDVLNATNSRLHWELSRVWKDIDEDPATNVVIITGKGRAFSAGGDLDMIDAMKGNHAALWQTMREAGDIVYNISSGHIAANGFATLWARTPHCTWRARQYRPCAWRTR